MEVGQHMVGQLAPAHKRRRGAPTALQTSSTFINNEAVQVTVSHYRPIDHPTHSWSPRQHANTASIKGISAMT